jgi:hypothetical protein
MLTFSNLEQYQILVDEIVLGWVSDCLFQLWVDDGHRQNCRDPDNRDLSLAIVLLYSNGFFIQAWLFFVLPCRNLKAGAVPPQ